MRFLSFTCSLKENHNDNGKKRSHWTVTVNGSKAQIDGILRIQVHYYEDGNVQLLSKKDATHELSVESGIFDQNVGPPINMPDKTVAGRNSARTKL